METNLTIEHLSPYLPYGLQICYRVLDFENGNPNTDNPEDRLKNFITTMTGAKLDNCLLPETDRWYKKDQMFKPILRPMRDFKKGELPNLMINDLGYTSGNKGKAINKYSNKDYEYWEYYVVNAFLKHHFDVFNLIEKGLAIDINTIEQK